MADEFSRLPANAVRQIADHIALYRRDPEKAHMWDSSVIGIPGPVATLLLRTTGRRSGQHRFAALQYFRSEGHFIVVGSKGGMPTHPAWFMNLQDCPDCEIQAGSLKATARARIAEGAERKRLWDAVTKEQPEYLKYERRTDREIPVVVFELEAGRA